MTPRVFITFFFLFPLTVFWSCSDDDLSVLEIQQFPNRTGDFSLWQLDQYDNESQMGYIIKTDDNQISIIDGGLNTSSMVLENFIVQLVDTVNTWVLTHLHKDHVGALLDILDRKRVAVRRIILSSLNGNWVEKNEKQNAAYVRKYNLQLQDSGSEIIGAGVGEVFTLGTNVNMRVLSIRNEEITVNAINNSSLTFKIESDFKSVLFLGDLEEEGGNKILKNTDRKTLASDYVQVSHHGQGGTARSFYAAVDAKYAYGRHQSGFGKII